MAKKRYVNTHEQSFFGHYLYDQMVSKNHFLRKLNELINWNQFTEQLIELYRGSGAYGRPPFNPTQPLKMCLLANFYNLSDRQVEVHVNENIPAKYFICSLVDQDMAQNVLANTYTADRGYNDGNNHFYLEHLNLQSAVCLKDNRTKKKDSNKEVWLEMVKSPAYKEEHKERYKIECKFGEAKQRHGLGRCRYVGLLKYGVQVYFTAIILNLKRMDKLLTGVGLKTHRILIS